MTGRLGGIPGRLGEFARDWGNAREIGEFTGDWGECWEDQRNSSEIRGNAGEIREIHWRFGGNAREIIGIHQISGKM